MTSETVNSHSNTTEAERVSGQTVIKHFRNRTWLEKTVASKLFWVLALVTLFVYPIYRSVNRELPPGPPALFQIPDYQLVNEFGVPFGSDDLRGRIYLANFIFTSCPSTCPAQTEAMKKIQKRVRGLGSSIALVSFTVDPYTDTPEVLYRYARQNQANPHVWSFLTGTEEELHDLLVNGFKVPVGEKEYFDSPVEDLHLYDIAHSERVALVDSEGYVRGFYSIDDISVDQLMIDIGLMVNRLELYNQIN